MAGPARVLAWTPDKKHSDFERWICIYPAYINSKKTLVQGRKIAKERCVENPTPQEMRDVLVAAGFNIGVENKKYCRERSNEITHRGRIRVQLKHDDGTVINEKFPTREDIMLHLTEMIPKLKTRQTKAAGEQANTGNTGGKGKKGKGRR